MSSNRSAPAPEVKGEFFETVLQYLQYSIRIPITHLIDQFLNPGIVLSEKESKDEKKADIFAPLDEEELKKAEPRPMLTRANAFECLIASIAYRRKSLKERYELSRLIIAIEEKEKNKKATEFEQVILIITDIPVTQPSLFLSISKKPTLQNNAYIQYLLGECFLDQKNYREAFFCFEKVNKSNLGIANNHIGQMFKEGHFLRENSQKALEEYRIGAERGSGFSMYNVGIYYALEKSPRDLKEATKYFCAAYRHGCTVKSPTAILSLITNEDDSIRQQFIMTHVYSLRISVEEFQAYSCFLLTEKNIKVTAPLAIFCLRVALLSAKPAKLVELQEEVKSIFSKYIENAAVTYHYNIVNKDQQALRGLLINDSVAFQELCYADIDSPIIEIKQQVIKQMVGFVPLEENELVRLPQRLRANFVIYHLQQRNDLDSEKAFVYLKGLGVNELTAEEKYQIGLLVYNDTMRRDAENQLLLKRHKLLGDLDEKYERLLFDKKDDEAIRFLTFASEAGHKEAKSLSATRKIMSNSDPALTTSPTLFSSAKRDIPDDKKDYKHTVRPKQPDSSTSSSAPARPLEEDDNKDDNTLHL